MKFLEAWHSIAKENTILKIVIIALVFASIFFSYGTVKLALREPLVIERGCYAKAIKPASTDVSTTELESFIKESLHQRFDSDAVVTSEFISGEEVAHRDQEQKELSQRGMLQYVFLESIEVHGNDVKVNADRLISVGPVRSAFPFPLVFKLSTSTRTESNPYGLTAEKISEEKKESGGKN